jgi:hypothetical protein
MPEAKFEATDLPEIKINLAEAEEDLPEENSPTVETSASQEPPHDSQDDKEEKMSAAPTDGVAEAASSDGGTAVVSSLGMKSTDTDWTLVYYAGEM